MGPRQGIPYFVLHVLFLQEFARYEIILYEVGHVT